MTTVDPKCFYSTDIELVKDNYESDSKSPSGGGVTSSLGSNIYFRIKPGSDCTKMGYYRVKLKYSRNLPKKSGELTLDGVVLSEGDLVWLDKQFDGGNGLWIVQSGDWVGLKSYMDQQLWVTCDCNVPEEVRETPYEGPQLICENIVVELGYLVLLTSQDDPNTNGVWQVTETGWVHISNTCDLPTSEPLPVDSNIIADLGVHVKDKVTVACDSDVPAKKRYGTQKICNTIVRPGDTVLLTNQSDGSNGVWEVTCAEWFQRSDTIPPHSGTTISGDDFVVVQNDIDFCTCEHSGKNIFHIWYYYLNGACYLARATRTVKITCGLKGSLFPSQGVDVTDYRISAEADPDLVKDTRRTAGDPVRETCMEEVENYDADHRVGIKDNRIGCGNELIIAPNGMKICRCNHVYNVDSETAFSSRDRNGFSIVFWQYDASDERWHLYAYIGAGRYDLGMNYYVYHLCTNGIAGEGDVDENVEVGLLGEDGRPLDETTHDAWFVTHGGKLAEGFGMFDDTWNFKLVDDETDEVSYSHVLNEKTLYSMWSVKCTTTMCGIRIYRGDSLLRNSCTCELKDGKKVDPNCVGMDEAEATSQVMTDVIATPDTWGFKFYNEAITKGRLCNIWNSMPH